MGAQIKTNEMDGASGIYGGEDRCIQGLVEKCDRKRPLVRCEDDIKMDLARNRMGGAWTGWIWLHDMDMLM